jgi:hypothetical protein
VVTTTIPIIKSKNWNWNGLSFLILIIQDLAKGFHWIAHFFAFKPATQVQADFYVPILEWGWNYAFGTRIVPIVANTTTAVAIITHNVTNPLSLAYYWVINLIGNTANWVLSDSLGHSISGGTSMSGSFPASTVGNYIPLYDTMTLTLPSSGVTRVVGTTTLTWTCTVNPGSRQVVELGQTATYNVNCPQPSWAYVNVIGNLSSNFGPAPYTLYSGEANYQAYYSVSGSGNGEYTLPLPGLSGYVWGMVTGRVPSNYAECYLYNASLPSIGSTPPQYPVSNGSVIELYIHCTPGTGTVYWVVNVQGSFNYQGEWVLTDSYGHEAVGMSSASGSFSVDGADTLSISILKWGSISCQVTSPSQVTVNPGQTATFNIVCTSSGSAPPPPPSPTPTSTPPPSTTTTTSTPPPSGVIWNIYVSVTDNYGAGYIITDSYGNSLQAAVSLSNVLFATFNSSTVSSDTLTASIQYNSPGESCTISPSSTTVSAPSGGGNVYVTFTVSCGSGSSPTSTPTPTPTPTPTSTPPPSPTSTPTSTTSSPPPTTVTTTGTNNAQPPPPTFTGFYQVCAQGSVPLGQAVAFECIVAWNGHTVTELAASMATQYPNFIESTTLYYDISNSPAGAIGSWGIQGSCPPGFYVKFGSSGGNFVVQLSGTTGTYTWYVTISAWCYNKHMPDFAFFTRWEPPELPITWLLRGGTNVESVIAPLYLRVWNAYVSEWLYENGFTLDLLILLALIMPILVKPASRRIKLT